MADYRKMYFQLCAAVERALEVMESDSESGAKLCRGQALLMEGMQACEDIYVETEG
jgi:hypothetical protein